MSDPNADLAYHLQRQQQSAAALQAVLAAARAVVDYGAPDGDPGRFVTAIVQLREALRAYESWTPPGA